MSVRERLTTTLAVSVALSILFLVLLRVTKSNSLFFLQLPGFYASAAVSSIHPSAIFAAGAALVFGWVNAIAYWPVIFVLSFFLKRNTPRRK